MVKLLGILLVISLSALPMVGCAKPLTLSITVPTEGATVDKSSVTVRGNVSNPKATVTLNDTQLKPNKKGYFWTEVELTEGINRIKVVATRGEEVVTRTVTVTYTPPSITENNLT